MARRAAGVRGWMPLAIYESVFLSPETGPMLAGETVGEHRQWWTFRGRLCRGELQVRGIERGGRARTVAASEATEYVAANFHGNRLIRKDRSWLGGVEVRIVTKGELTLDQNIVDALTRHKRLQPGGRRAACKAVARELGITAVRVNELYGSLPEELRRAGRPRVA